MNKKEKTVVCKFGGTSLSSAANISKVKDIINADPARRIVVVSAPGKRNDADIKVTDTLYELFGRRESETEADSLIDILKRRFLEIEKNLRTSPVVESEFEEISKCYRTSSRDFLASRGEYINGRIIAAHLGFHFADAAEVIAFNDDLTVNLELTSKNLQRFLKLKKPLLIPGFYGSSSGGEIVTFSRGGSDTTGAVIARCANAELYENWTDVDGFLAADPRICENPKIIKTLTCRELRELSYMGASVLHSDCAYFVRDANIPINIKNTFNPAAGGTLITDGNSNSAHQITGIAGQKGFEMIAFEKYNLNNIIGLFESVSKIFLKHKTSLEHLPTSIDGVSAIYKPQSAELTQTIINDLESSIKPDKIELRKGIALICVALGGLTPTEAMQIIFETLGKNNIAVKIVSFESSSVSITIGLDEQDYINTIKLLFTAFGLKKKKAERQHQTAAKPAIII